MTIGRQSGGGLCAFLVSEPFAACRVGSRVAEVGSAEPMDVGSEAAALGAWQCRERITSLEGLRMSWMQT